MFFHKFLKIFPEFLHNFSKGSLEKSEIKGNFGTNFIKFCEIIISKISRIFSIHPQNFWNFQSNFKKSKFFFKFSALFSQHLAGEQN